MPSSQRLTFTHASIRGAGRGSRTDPRETDHNPAELVMSRMTESQALVNTLAESSRAAQVNFQEVCGDLEQRTELLRECLKECRKLRLAGVLSAKGEVTQHDKDKHRPPRLQPISRGGCHDASEYILVTLQAARRLILEDHQYRMEIQRSMGNTNEALNDLGVGGGTVRARDDDDLTVVSDWNDMPDPVRY